MTTYRGQCVAQPFGRQLRIGSHRKAAREEEMDRNEIKIPIFDGVDYSMWKKRLMLYLKLKKCNVAIERVKLETDNTDWDKKDLLALNYIYSAITNKKMEFVCDEMTVYDIIKEFDSRHSKEPTTLQIICRKNLEKTKLDNYSDSASYLSEFEKAVNEFKSAGAQINEKEKLNYMLNTLPNSYSHIGDLIDNLKPEDQKVADVKNKIGIAEKKQKGEYEERKTNAFAAKKKGCYTCGGMQFSRDCMKNKGE